MHFLPVLRQERFNDEPKLGNSKLAQIYDKYNLYAEIDIPPPPPPPT